MLNQTGDLSSGLLNQLRSGLPHSQAWEGSVPSTASFPANSGLAAGGMHGAALTGAASGLQAAAQSLLRQRMEALRQHGLRGSGAPAGPVPGQWDREVMACLLAVNCTA